MKLKSIKKIKMRTGFIIFLLFFGVAFLEALRSKNWIAVAYWFGIASLFLLMDNLTKDENSQHEDL